MPFNLRSTLDWLYEEGTEKAFGPKVAPVWLEKGKVPRNSYRRVLFIMGDVMGTGILAPEKRMDLMKGMEATASEAGFRLLRIQPRSIEVPTLEGVPHQVFTAYAASDLVPLDLSELSKALFGAPVIMSSEDVSISERTTLDAVWASQGAGSGLIDSSLNQLKDIKPTLRHKVDVWPLIGLGVAGLAVGLGVWSIVSGRK